VGIQLLNRTERLWLFWLLSASNDDSSWHKKCRRLKTAFPILTSFRRARRGSFLTIRRHRGIPFYARNIASAPFSCWNARRKQVEGGHQWMLQTLLSAPRGHCCHICFSFNTKKPIKRGNIAVIVMVPARGASSDYFIRMFKIISVLAHTIFPDFYTTSDGGTSV